MKLSIVFLAILGLAVAAPAEEVHSRKARGAAEDLDDFLALVPVDKVLEIVVQYLAEDEQFQSAMLYIQTEEFHNIVKVVTDCQEYMDFLDFLESLGLGAYNAVNFIHSIIGIDELERSKRSVSRATGGINGMVDEILAILPIDEIKALYNEKLETSPEFVSLIQAFASDEFQVIVTKLRADPGYQELLSKLMAVGVDVDKIITLCRTMIGIE